MLTHGRSSGAHQCAKIVVLSFMGILTFSAGCSASRGGAKIESRTLSAAGLIERCAGKYAGADTIRAQGRLILHGEKHEHTRLVTWDFSRPEKTRLRVGERVAVIRDGEWYRYDPMRDAYRRHPGLGGDPMHTAVYFMTDGAPMPELSIPTKGPAALGNPDDGQWRLGGVRWVSERPCYVLLHPYSAERSDLTLAIWIDQETCLLRGWAVQQVGADMDDPPVISCEYDAIELNAPIADDQFAVGRDNIRTVAHAGSRRR